MLPFEVIYEDQSLIVINKPAGLMVEPDRFGNPNVDEEIKKYFIEKRVSQNTIVGIVHRLDRPVSGVLLVAKKISILREINAQFEKGEIDKTYFAIVENPGLKQEDNLQHYLRKDPKQQKAIIYKNKQNGTSKCELIYRVVKTENELRLVEIHLVTGKYHQIRAQFSFIGHPVVGDKKYGATEPYRTDAICLHSNSIEFFHPVEKRKLKFVSEIPTDWPVNLT